MAKTTQAGPVRPAGLDPQAVWPPRVTFGGTVTVTDGLAEGRQGVVFRQSTTPSAPHLDETSPAPTTTADVPAPRARRTRGRVKR